MKILRMVAIVVVALLVVALAVGALLPRTWRVERSVTIAAPPERIYPFLAHLRHWQEWSVWTKEMDPQLRNSFEGPDTGVGARWSWLGPKMGRGRMEIVEASPALGVKLDEAIESESVNAHASLLFSADAAGTRVTWVDEGTLPPVLGGYFHGMVEAMLGANFENGLKKLKAVVEALPPPVAHPPSPPSEPADAGVDAGS